MNGRSPILEKAARPLYRVLLASAVWILFRGHNAPGGGFIGGLVAVAATAAHAMVFGTASAEKRLPFSPVSLAVSGTLLAVASGLPALLWPDRPYLTHLWWQISIWGMHLPLSTVLVFDAGVFLAVWGALSGYVLALLKCGEPEKGETP